MAEGGLMAIFGGEDVFFDLLEKQARCAVSAVDEFARLAADMAHAEAHAQALEKVESDADILTHELTNKTDAQFITPYDKEDIHALSAQIDDVIDLIEAAAARVLLFRLTEPHAAFQSQVVTLKDTVDAMAEAVFNMRRLRDHKRLNGLLTAIHAKENAADQSYRKALQVLFDDATDALFVMKWKEIFERIEAAADKCEAVAVTLEGIVVKYA